MFVIEVVSQPTISLSNNNSTLHIASCIALFFEKQHYFHGRKIIIEVIGQPQCHYKLWISRKKSQIKLFSKIVHYYALSRTKKDSIGKSQQF